LCFSLYSKEPTFKGTLGIKKFRNWHLINYLQKVAAFAAAILVADCCTSSQQLLHFATDVEFCSKTNAGNGTCGSGE